MGRWKSSRTSLPGPFSLWVWSRGAWQHDGDFDTLAAALEVRRRLPDCTDTCTTRMRDGQRVRPVAGPRHDPDPLRETSAPKRKFLPGRVEG